MPQGITSGPSAGDLLSLDFLSAAWQSETLECVRAIAKTKIRGVSASDRHHCPCRVNPTWRYNSLYIVNCFSSPKPDIKFFEVVDFILGTPKTRQVRHLYLPQLRRLTDNGFSE